MINIRNFAFAGVSLLAIASPAMAQDAAESDAPAFASSEIVVQARRKEESIQDVPLVVQAVSGSDLQRLEVRQFEDVTRLVPGLQLVANSNGLGTTASLRGVNFDANASGASTTVEFYRNDAVITSGALFQAMYDIGQVEVLRGPQGTLRGRASPSGSITVTTRRPDLGEVGGYISGSLTDQSRWNGNAAINVPIIADKLGVRVAGFVGETDGNGITGLNVRTGAADTNIYDTNRALRASVRADPFDGVLVLDFNFETVNHENRQYDQVQSFAELVPSAGVSPVFIRAKDRIGVTPSPRTTDQNYKIYNWQAQLNLFGQQLTYVGSKIDASIRAQSPQDAAGLYTSEIPVATPGNPFVQLTDNTTKQTTHEIRLQNAERIVGLFDYVVGYMSTTANSPSFLNNITAFGSANTLYAVSNLGLNRYRADIEKSIFGNATVHLTDRLEISGGVRQIWFKANSGVQTGTYGAPTSTYAESPTSRRCFGFSAIAGCLPVKKARIYSANVKYDITDDVMVYASYGTSWRPGNSVIGFRGAETGPFLSQFLNLPDETSKSFEVGLKTSWLDNRVRFNISGYSQKFQNYAYRVASPVIALSTTTNTLAAPAALATGFNFVSAVPATVKGFEADLAFDVSPNFNLGATVSFADGKIKDGLFPCLDLNNDNVPDTTTPTAQQLFAHVGANQVDTCRGNASPSSSARWAATFQAEYSRALGQSAEGYMRGFLNWKGNNDGFSLNPYDQVKSFGLVDLFVGVRDPDGGWDVSLFAKNLLNTKRVLTRTDSASITALRAGQNLAAFGGAGISINSSSATNYLGITTNDPREFGVTARFTFGSR